MLPVIRKNGLRLWNRPNPFHEMEHFLDNFWSPDTVLTRDNFGKLDMYEDEKSLHVDVELPGVQRQDIDLSLEDGVLHLQTEQSTENTDEKENYYIKERTFGEWSRSVTLPIPVNQENIEAVFKDGILKISLEKSPEQQKHKINVH
jgi:HSP20 family protein